MELGEHRSCRHGASPQKRDLSVRGSQSKTYELGTPALNLDEHRPRRQTSLRNSRASSASERALSTSAVFDTRANSRLIIRITPKGSMSSHPRFARTRLRFAPMSSGPARGNLSTYALWATTSFVMPWIISMVSHLELCRRGATPTGTISTITEMPNKCPCGARQASRGHARKMLATLPSAGRTAEKTLGNFSNNASNIMFGSCPGRGREILPRSVTGPRSDLVGQNSGIIGSMWHKSGEATRV